MAKLSEVAGVLNAISEQLEKAKDEILVEIETLKASDPELSVEGNAALTRLSNIAQAFDDVNPDPAEA